MTDEFPPHVIDMAIIATICMLVRGKAVVWQEARMYRTAQGTCINGEIVGDVVDATILWFERYSKANPRKSNWGETSLSIDFLRRRFA
jgi:hypothetical protein